jgi:hypothetical protein
MAAAKKLDAKQRDQLLETIKARFEKRPKRHLGIAWSSVEKRLLSQPAKLWSLNEMEAAGGEPDVIEHDAKSGEIVFIDCSAESPNGRRSVCYDREGLESRKEHRPESSAIDMANAMGIELLNEAQYRALQELGTFDAKTSSWLLTPLPIRKLGGALFGDYRYGQVFIYHNGAQSYYGSRGFRGALKL